MAYMLHLTNPKYIGKERGSVIILTLWVLIILTIFATSLAKGASSAVSFAGYFKDKAIAYNTAKGGVKKVIKYILEDENKDYDSKTEPWLKNSQEDFKDIPLGSGRYSVYHKKGEELIYGASDEEGRININKASKDTLNNLIQIGGGLAKEEAANIAAAIIDWIDADSKITDEIGAEDTYYEALSKPYGCKNSAIDTIEEILLIKGITPSIFAKIADYITIYGEGKVNINTAEQTVLEILGIDASLASKILIFRNGGDTKEGTEDDNYFENTDLGTYIVVTDTEAASYNKVSGQLSVKSNNFRIQVDGYASSSPSSIKAVIDRKKAKEAKVVYWHEE